MRMECERFIYWWLSVLWLQLQVNRGLASRLQSLNSERQYYRGVTDSFGPLVDIPPAQKEITLFKIMADGLISRLQTRLRRSRAWSSRVSQNCSWSECEHIVWREVLKAEVNTEGMLPKHRHSLWIVMRLRVVARACVCGIVWCGPSASQSAVVCGSVIHFQHVRGRCTCWTPTNA